MKTNGRIQVWSCGGGTQSAALAALLVRGDLPRPDYAVMVDTEREKSGTWDYMGETLLPALLAAGVALQIVRRSDFCHHDLYSGTGGLLIPAFSDQSGSRGKMGNFCSSRWKREVQERWLRTKGVREYDQWFGISADEAKRVRVSRDRRVRFRYPLIFDVEWPMRRADCVALVRAMGWPDPPRSACWMCPNMGDSEWTEMRDSHPADFAAAVALEAEVQQTDPHAFLHRSGVPLAGVEFAEETGQADGCDTGFCFT